MLRRGVFIAVGVVLAVLWAERTDPRSVVQPPSTPEARAVAFLAREVPRWRREHPCYSCHNNGDAARALITASRRAFAIGGALDDTLDWLKQPAAWNAEMPSGGFDDKPLARIQFGSALRLAVAARLAPAAALDEAAAFIAADQQQDGSWRLDTSQSLGSPATYGTALATSAARLTLAAAARDDLRPVLDRADRWLRTAEVETVLDCAAVMLGIAGARDDAARRQQALCLEVIARGQSNSGGWGPYVTSPPEVFDTALVLLALEAAARAEPGRAPSRAARQDAVARGRAFLVAQQLPDGSWPETTRPSGQESYAQRISTAGWALLALLETQ